jgi:hypothetical protein
MGNIEIPLPENMKVATADPSIGILDETTPLGSRSVLKDEIEADGSPRSLSVLPAYGTKVRKPSTFDAPEPRDIVPTKRTLSWADVARK